MRVRARARQRSGIMFKSRKIFEGLSEQFCNRLVVYNDIACSYVLEEVLCLRIIEEVSEVYGIH